MQRKCCKHQSKCQGKCLLWPGMAMRSSPGLDTQTQALGLTLPPGDHRTWSDTALIWALEDSPPPPRFLPQAAYSRSSEPPHADLLSKPEPTQGEVGQGRDRGWREATEPSTFRAGRHTHPPSTARLRLEIAGEKRELSVGIGKVRFPTFNSPTGQGWANLSDQSLLSPSPRTPQPPSPPA